jgi:hypothetical protein
VQPGGDAQERDESPRAFRLTRGQAAEVLCVDLAPVFAHQHGEQLTPLARESR